MDDVQEKTRGQQILDDTLSLARVIADLCITSNLKTLAAIEKAIDIARKLVEANAAENRKDDPF